MTILKQYIPQNFCLKCVGCCRFADIRSKWSPCFLDEEIKLLKSKGIRLSLRPQTNKAKLVFLRTHYFCPFFTADKNSCSIYKFRPLDCALYPFLLRGRAGKVYLAVDKNCPYVEETFETKEFKAYLDKLFQFLKQPRVAGAVRRNRKIIGNFTEKSVVNLFRLPFLEK